MKFIHNIKKFMVLRRSAFATLPAACLLAGAALSSCVSEDLPDCPVDTPNTAGSEYLLSFKISMPTLGSSTRAGSSEVDEAYENYIDPSKMVIMFFTPSTSNEGDSEGDGDGEGGDIDSGEQGLRSRAASDISNEDYKLFYKFQAGDPALSMIPVAYANTPEKEAQGQKEWYVRIEIPKVVDGEQFAQTLRDKPFRIAVMANTVSDVTSGTVSIEEGDFVNVLHHQTTTSEDPYTKDDKSKRTYDFIHVGNPNNKYEKVLGHFTDWVTKGNENVDLSSEAKARLWIRNNWNPANESNYNDGEGTPYVNLWSVWNFSGYSNANYTEYLAVGKNDEIPVYTDFSTQWQTRNGEVLSQWIGDTNDAPLSDLTAEDYESVNEPTPLYFKNKDGVKAVIDGDKKAVHLPEVASGDLDDKERIKSNGKGFFTFHANATGYLFITAKHNHDSSSKPNNDVVVVAQIGNSEKFVTYNFKYATDGEVNGIETKSQKIQITTASKDVYVYVKPKDGNSLDIYQIEYIQDKYLCDTDRKGVAPSEEHPIPMYGIQTYDKLANLWEPGTTFDLDNYNYISNDYPVDVENPDRTYFHPIYLLRSVAKVEVKIPTSLGPHHVYLRSMNRYARWEPTDVVSNTNDIWTVGHSSTENPLAEHYCEWFNIQNQGIFYNPDSQLPSQTVDGKDENGKDIITGYPQLEAYQKKLAWFYGSWATGNSIGGVSFDEAVDKKNNFDYPRIMNALVSRSDFCRFLYAGEDGIYSRYILYVPEKYIDDPDSNDLGGAMETSSPKICHVEFRVAEDPYQNIDDDECYRIYFTKDGVYGDPPALNDDDHGWETQYENQPDKLRQHWPIVRNHYYTFTVQDISNKVAVVSIEVLPWRQVNDISVSW